MEGFNATFRCDMKCLMSFFLLHNERCSKQYTSYIFVSSRLFNDNIQCLLSNQGRNFIFLWAGLWASYRAPNVGLSPLPPPMLVRKEVKVEDKL